MNKRIISLIIAVLFVFAGCDAVYEYGNGNLSNETHRVDDFESIKIDGNFQVILSEGSRSKVEVLADENLHEFIEVVVERGMLIIDATERIESRKGIKVYVTYESLEEVSIRGASVLENQDAIDETFFKITIDGAGVAELELDVKNLEVEMRGAGLIELFGRARKMNVDISGTGNLNAYELESRNCEIELNGVGAAQVNVTRSLDARLSGVGGITYKGDPEDIKQVVSGVGSIKPADEDSKGVELDI